MLCRGHSDRGFTIVELVCTLAVLGVLVGVASTQFFESKTFDERITSDAILSLARNAQLIALSNANVDLLFEESGSEIEVSVRVAGVKQVSRSFNKAEAMNVDGSSFGGTPGVCAVIPSAVSLQFDPKAEIRTSLGNYSQGFPVCVNGASTSLCVSTAGFPHEGSCL